MKKPPTKINILDFTKYLPGPFCTELFVQLGAKVIKIEQPKIGDQLRNLKPIKNGTSIYFEYLNRGKKSIAIDIKSIEGQTIIKKIIQYHDIIIEAFSPNFMKSIGLDYLTLKKINPKIIYCSIHGYHSKSKLSRLSGHDLNFMSTSGALFNLGNHKNPILPSGLYSDLLGAWNAAFLIQNAILNRFLTGKGAFIEVSLFDNVISAIYIDLLKKFHFPRITDKHMLDGNLAKYNIYKTKDGRYVSIASIEDKYFHKLIEILKIKSTTNLNRSLKHAIAQKNFSYWVKLYNKHNICLTPLFSIEETIQEGLLKHLIKRNQGKSYIDYPLNSSWVLKKKSLKIPILGEHNNILQTISSADCNK